MDQFSKANGAELAGINLSMFCAGRTIDSLWKSKNILMIRFTDGDTVEIGWADTNGNPTEGEPVGIRRGRHVFAQTAKMGARGG